MVGCVIADAHGTVIAEGVHRRCGGPHAEAVALAAAGGRARGAIAYVTLEPCAHHGRTPPCADALIRAGVSRVVYACPDPHHAARGGAGMLRAAGIAAERVPHAACDALAAPFMRRTVQRMPWVVAKWAATTDGRCAAEAGAGRWVSSARSRTMVHRERGRVDAILTGIGTVLADDPHLLPRGVSARRTPRRIVVDRMLRLPPASRLACSAREGPVEIACSAAGLAAAPPAQVSALERAGIGIAAIDDSGDAGLFLHRLLARLHADGVSTALTEAGPRLVGALLAADLVDDAWIFTSRTIAGDPASAPWPALDPARFACVDERRRGTDAMARWRRLPR